MVSNEKKLEILQEYFSDSDGDISLSGLDAPGLVFDFSDIKAEQINNINQKAKYIYNSRQEAEEIDNSEQEAKAIYNGCQEAEFINNSSQQAETIYNRHQKSKEIYNDNQIIIDKKAERIKELKEELYNLENS